MKRICIVTAVPATVNAFLREHILLLSQSYDLTVVTSISDISIFGFPNNIRIVSIDIERDVNIIKDLVSLVNLAIFFKKEKFDVVLSVTPKAGLLTALAGCFAQINHRIHWFTGQVWVTQTGFRRGFLKSVDKILASCITSALIDSKSQFNFLINENVLKGNKGLVLGSGSICGVNLERFKFNQTARNLYRKKIGLGDREKVVIFLGRLNKDKGILDLVGAFNKVTSKINDLHLVLVGPDEESIEKILSDNNCLHKNIHFTGATLEPEKWLSIADVFCLPSYREGFGSSVIEAAAVGLPTIASRIYGLTDAVVEGETGLMHQVGNIDELSEAIHELISNDELRIRLGNNGRDRAEKLFSQDVISNLLLDYLNNKLE